MNKCVSVLKLNRLSITATREFNLVANWNNSVYTLTSSEAGKEIAMLLLISTLLVFQPKGQKCFCTLHMVYIFTQRRALIRRWGFVNTLFQKEGGGHGGTLEPAEAGVEES